MSDIDAYPLSWPLGWKRTPAGQRRTGAYQVTMARARDDLFAELARMGAKDIILSTNIAVRLDGLPYAKQRNPDDPGAAVYFKWKNRPYVFACDLWLKVDHNIRAIGLTVSAIRLIERSGASDMLERAFTGFAALPGPAAASWRDVLGVTDTPPWEVVESVYRIERASAHPDRGGTPERFQAVQVAFREAKREYSR